MTKSMPVCHNLNMEETPFVKLKRKTKVHGERGFCIVSTDYNPSWQLGNELQSPSSAGQTEPRLLPSCKRSG
ncbi:hypothetical protein EYF80_029935 [Liparis tanakae]|uniref:Uncharacterized protein n=1 Tax=Liparis tanakae TaxID=230148 RepID=A0A4Z2H234_9TELE|nr:hypothetical protein EYF80_029935 [Liparis tanakae]